MHYRIIKDLIKLLEEFEADNAISNYTLDIDGFMAWIRDKECHKPQKVENEPHWVGKEDGRSVESAICTMIVHTNRYAKTYSKSAIADSEFSTQEDFIYLINLKAFGSMSKMDLIKKNIQDKPGGMLIITRLLKQGFIEQTDSEVDKRNKVIKISEKGLEALEANMQKIKNATKIVTGNLNYNEKLELIKILNKLDHFHNPIFSRNINSKDLIETVLDEYSFLK
ncbi:MarR family winged helix-turn-helix transcriptional regulator [Chryseobacterium sp. MMS23-Vi53]|uniref:MarR family winged helix-turn-helix transcriptional regulator n=1 Tax=Chryseobacterium sp. MMS23-Vi53 TaxID=3386644 RepID=UPI0039EB3478